MRNLLIILSSIVLLASCSKQEANTNNPLIEDSNKMVNFLFDIHLSEALEKEKFIKETESKILYTKIFEKYDVTTEQFDEAILYYTENNNDYLNVYEKVTNKFNQYLSFSNQNFFTKYPAENLNIWKDYAIFPSGLSKMTQFLPFYICPKPEYLEKPLIIIK